MNAKNHSSDLQYAVKDAPRIKTIGLQMGVTDTNLEEKIKEAFALAKSGGRELDLTFGPGSPRQNTPGQLRAP